MRCNNAENWMVSETLKAKVRARKIYSINRCKIAVSLQLMCYLLLNTARPQREQRGYFTPHHVGTHFAASISIDAFSAIVTRNCALVRRQYESLLKLLPVKPYAETEFLLASFTFVNVNC